MAFEIDYNLLEMAMSSYDPTGQTIFYLDPASGQVLIVDEYTREEARSFTAPDQIEDPNIRLAWYVLWDEGEIEDDTLSPAEEGDWYDQVHAYLDRYPPIPTADSREGYQDMVDFTETVTDLYLRERLDQALARPRPFRRFKDVLLGDLKQQDRWFKFRDERMRARMDDWLRMHGVLPAEEDLSS